MDSGLPVGYRFFKPILTKNFEDELVFIMFFPLPPLVSKKVKHLASVVIVGPSQVWEVRLKHFPQCSFLKHGWGKVVRATDINIGYFLVFKHLGGYRFSPHVFDKTATEVEATAIHHMPEEKTMEEDSKATDPLRINCHAAIILPYNLTSYLYLPREFCEKNNRVEDVIVTLVGPKGNEWKAKYKTYLETKGYGALLTSWSKFANDIGLKVGDQCVLEFEAHPHHSNCFVVKVSVKK